MKYLAVAKVIIMVVALFVVIKVMRTTNAGTVSQMLASVGIEAGGPQSPGLHPASGPRPLGPTVAMNLCPTRIRALSWSDGRTIAEAKDGMKLTWMAGEPSLREIGSLDMEKWLSRHCQIEVEPQTMKGNESVAFKPLVKVEYVDQASMELFRSDSGLYRLGQKVFTSLELNRAISELTQVANFTKAANVP